MERVRSAGPVLDSAVEVLMATTLVFLPLAYGTTEAWSQEVWYGLVAAMGACVLTRAVIDRGRAWTRTFAYVPIVLFVGLVLLQQLPLPRGLAEMISPATVSTKDRLLQGVAAPDTFTLTFYPFATARETRWVLAAATIFVVVLQTYRRTARVKRLLISVTAAGLCVAAVGAYGVLTGADTIYGTVPVGHKNSGPFQNYSHYSQFMNLSIGGAVALLCLTLAEWSAATHRRIDYAANLRDVANIHVYPAALLVIIGPLLILAASSRMGMISTLVAGVATAALIGRRGLRPGRSPPKAGGAFWAVVFAVAVVAVLTFVGLDRFTNRLATLQGNEGSTTRLQIVKDLLAVYRQFPLFGTGLGTHEFVYPMFSHTGSAALFTHAENEYAQLLEETGGVGVALILAFGATVVVAFWRVTRSPKKPADFAAAGLGLGLIAIVLHSLTDFGQHVPANATLTATFAGLVVGMSRRSDGRPASRGSVQPADAADRDAVPTDAARRSPLAFAARLAGLVTFVGVAGFVVYRGDVARRAEDEYRTARQMGAEFELAQWAVEPDAVRTLLGHIGRAHDLEPASVLHAHWLNAYRWRVVAAGATDPATRRLELSAEDIDSARRVVAEQNAARKLCPSFGPPLCVAGQIKSVALSDPSGEQDVMTAYALTPYDRVTSYAAGTLAARRGDFATAGPALARYVALGGPRWHVVDTYLIANRPDLAFEAAAPDRWNLERLAGGLEAGWPDQTPLAAESRRAAEALLMKDSDAPDAAPATLADRGDHELRAGREDAAVAWLQRAVDAEYGQVDWRLRLAHAQAAVGRREDAVQNIRVCLRLRPSWPAAESLLAKLSGRETPATGR